MNRVIVWLQDHERKMFLRANHKISTSLTYAILSRLTHLGGATITIVTTLCIGLFAVAPWSGTALKALLALALSHIPVAIIKKKYPRLRPYLVLPEANACKKPLKDHSFPSGHTTAIFSVVTPFLIAAPILSLILLPLAMLVGFSRMYLGLHYPSDVAAGCVIGVGAGAAVSHFIV
ncbi:phosphatase PAP2 family protein [Paenibacillus turpanensis]|uniref:phosphatase PAP2 family protein n=1 Tax=Paenibacillus turpanensis TaxID=2689078 RepID=UPI001408BF22|nr:phosphatase PAP2 family protein [Paenibacillus turpanensis]